MSFPPWVILMVIVVVQTMMWSIGSTAGPDDSRQEIMNAMEILLHKQEKMDQSVDTMSVKIATLSKHVSKIADNVKQKTGTGILDILTNLSNDVKGFSDDAKAVQTKITAFKSVMTPKLDILKDAVADAQKLVSSFKKKAKEPKIPQPAPVTSAPPAAPAASSSKIISHRRRGRHRITDNTPRKTSMSRTDKKDRKSHISYSKPKPKPKPKPKQVDDWAILVKKYKYLLDKEEEDRKKAKVHRSSSIPNLSSSLRSSTNRGPYPRPQVSPYSTKYRNPRRRG